MGNNFSKGARRQTFNIPPPPLTEANLLDQTGKVVIITGGYAGVGQELSRILYQKNATVYVAGRSAEKGNTSIATTKQLFPKSRGQIHFLSIDLADLRSIKPAVQEFLAKESRLDVLVNNAGVMSPPVGSKSAQGHELQLAVHALGHFLFTDLLTPVLQSTAADASVGSVRIVWAGSIAIEAESLKDGIQFDARNNPLLHNKPMTDYGQSKAADLFLATEFARRYGHKGIVSVCVNPGLLKTELQRHNRMAQILGKYSFHPAIFGAYSELWAGWSDDVKVDKNGRGFLGIPWGRNDWENLRKDLIASIEDGEVARLLWDWVERESRDFR